ncbi:RatA -like protein [Salmonella enterica]|nr:RatA -like protein [Salmonella enterica]
MLLTPDTTHSVAFTAMPRDFSVTADSNKMQAVNPRDTEGDIFSTPPLRWENQQSPTVGLVWADAATPDEPLNPQPVQNQTFCAQNLAGRHLVVWPEIESDDTSPIPTLYLWTTTGIPNSNTVSLLQQKIAIDIAAATGEPVTVSATHYNESLAASKVKAGESITLTITTKDCAGNPVGNAPFVIRRDDALNRKGVVNNDKPVHVGDTELTTTTTFYRGTTSADGTASVVVTQPDGPGVKTPLIISSESFPELKTQTDVIFTTLTSPDSELAAMYGHMQESATAELNGVTYTFTRPKLAAETSNTSGTVVDKNETWAQFNWAGADNHCDILPDAEQIVAMRNAHDTEATYTGWPVTNDAEYWSSTKDQLEEYHYAVHINSGRVIRESNRSAFLVSCVDKALPAAHPQITLSPSARIKQKSANPLSSPQPSSTGIRNSLCLTAIWKFSSIRPRTDKACIRLSGQFARDH